MLLLELLPPAFFLPFDSLSSEIRVLLTFHANTFHLETFYMVFIRLLLKLPPPCHLPPHLRLIYLLELSTWTSPPGFLLISLCHTEFFFLNLFVVFQFESILHRKGVKLLAS